MKLCRLGTAGRPGTERLMRLPRRMYSLGKGFAAWLYWGVRAPLRAWDCRVPLGALLQVLLRDVDLLANRPMQSADNRLEIRRVLAAPLVWGGAAARW